jgi:hypothetical protein
MLDWHWTPGSFNLRTEAYKQILSRDAQFTMLERIELIQGIGLLHDANGKPHRCHKATMVYADNGRGKSTLASVLRAASTGDATRMNACKTVDGTLLPKAILQFGRS